MCKTVVFVGTYTQPIRFGTGEVLQGHGKGIYCYVLKDDQMVECTVAQTVNASFLTMDHKQRHLYATNELKEYQGLPGGAVSAFRFDPQTMEIQYLNTQPVGGADPCHIEMDSEDEHLYCANFMSGSVTVLPIKRDGALDEQSCLIQHQGSSVNPTRQQGPHAHGIFLHRTIRCCMYPTLAWIGLCAIGLQKQANWYHNRTRTFRPRRQVWGPGIWYSTLRETTFM